MDLKFNVRIQVKKLHNDAESRIAAKARLWDFLNDTKESWVNWQDSPEEMATQLITTCLGIMYGPYNAIETEKEVRSIYTALLQPLPPQYFELYTICLTRYVKARMFHV